MSKPTLFPNLPRQPPRQRGRPRLYSAESIALLERAYARMHVAADTDSHILARQFVGQATDDLRRAGARDLAALADRALADAIGHPDVGELLERINRRITDRKLKSTGVI